MLECEGIPLSRWTCTRVPPEPLHPGYFSNDLFIFQRFPHVLHIRGFNVPVWISRLRRRGGQVLNALADASSAAEM